MFYRIKQFYSAMTAVVPNEETEFVSEFLTPKEEKFFYEMSIVDQRHALDVAHHIYELLLIAGLLEGEPLLVKAALLHDVGKRQGDLTVFDRSLIVILECFFPGQIAKWAVEGRGGLIQNRRHAFYVAKYHGRIGAEWLKKIDCPEEVIILVRDHHLTDIKDWRMQILQEADGLY